MTFATHFWIISIVTLGCTPQFGHGQHAVQNTPPVMMVDRNWRLLETKPVGSLITQVRASDSDDDNLQFGLDFQTNYNFPLNTLSKDAPIPFWIDPDSGEVYLNATLLGRGGENFFLYVTVSDGTLTAKNEVYVNILSQNTTKRTDLYNPVPPSFTGHVHNMSHLLPPFGLLPGVPRQTPPRPTNIDIYNNSPYLPAVRHPPPPSSAPPLLPFAGSNVTHPDVDKKSSSTILRPVQTAGVPGSGASASTTNNDSSKRMPTTSHGGSGENSGDDDSVGIKKLLPLLLSIAGIVVVGAVIVLLVFRKRLCAIGKSLKKKSKEEMTKKSNQSQISISGGGGDDGRDSMAMQQWSRPMAYSNRYVPWERDHPAGMHQPATMQPSNGSTASQTQHDLWEFPRYRLKFFNILGEGAFGQVWRCEALDIDGNEGISTVAVKTLKENATEMEKHDLLSELQVMKALEPHINVVRLLGCCTDKDPIFVVIEYVNKGKLQTYLRNSRAERHYGNTHGKSKTLTSGNLTSFMYQIARGMDFLSSRGIIHRDLAARNILITDEHTCKVADFGFARDIVTSKIYERKSEGKLPIRWMAIESLYDNIFSVKSDIWSFGILMWEIVTLGSTPYPGIAAADVMRKVRDGYRLEKPDHCRRELYNIMYYCWAKDSKDRPTFTDLVQLLDKLLQTETDYIELERFPDHNYYNMLSLSGEKL